MKKLSVSLKESRFVDLINKKERRWYKSKDLSEHRDIPKKSRKQV